VVFNSLEYALFLPVVLGLYWLIKDHRRQNVLLLTASYIFYGWWDYRFLGLMMFSTVVDYFVGRLLAATDDDRRRKRIFFISLIVNLGILGSFKYFNFFIDSAASALQTLGLEANLPTLRVLLPIGISFYTFHGISYTFDVYRREIEPCRNLLTFACFIAFFPQLVAGPIGRAHIQLPQFEHRRKRPTTEDVRSACVMILVGLFKKVAIADALAPFVNDAFATSGRASAVTLLAGMYGFALQIYGDFSGYSDIARGSARLFGIDLIRNFEQPYLSRNITAFWRTWHISLSTWLRDYLYVPLGGNRGSRWQIYRNLLITMVLGGLWHGAAWTFVVWGALHGVFLAVHRAMGGTAHAPVRGPHVEGHRSVTVNAPPFTLRDFLPAAVTFHLVCFAWIFFRADSIGQAVRYIAGMASLRGGAKDVNMIVILLLAGAAVFLIDLLQRNTGSETPVLYWSPVVRGVVYGALVVAIIVFSGGTPVPFIYFQF
jgi:alginate O-acetyltransferase complex protein AlgI